MADAIQTVLEFLTVLSSGREGLDDAPRRWFTPETIWENVGVATTVGVDEALAFNRKLQQTTGVAALRVETLAIAATGGKVLTERVDDMLDASGNKLGTMRVMGIFEVDDASRITHWRDYFDTMGMREGER